jgi:hypothetical protein
MSIFIKIFFLSCISLNFSMAQQNRPWTYDDLEEELATLIPIEYSNGARSIGEMSFLRNFPRYKPSDTGYVYCLYKIERESGLQTLAQLSPCPSVRVFPFQREQFFEYIGRGKESKYHYFALDKSYLVAVHPTEYNQLFL